MKIVIAIDSFKGCLTSREAGEAAAEGVRAARPDCQTLVIPVADGGEGTLDALLAAHHGTRLTLQAHDPLMRLCQTSYGISQDGRTAFIEMAAISGLPLLAPEERNPMLTTSYGTGELIRDALLRGCTHIVVGLGGSATNDAGIGILQALGYQIILKAPLNPPKRGTYKSYKTYKTHMPYLSGKDLQEIETILSPFGGLRGALSCCTFTAACDVRNPFCGPDGAARVFAPQKGATPEMVEQLDRAMQRFASVIRRATGTDITSYPGAGAAGGIGGTLHALLRATLKPGIQLLLESLNFAEQIRDADLIITGEGKADRQTLMGKLPMGILQAAARRHIPVVLLAGTVEDPDLLTSAGFRTVRSINPPTLPLSEALRPVTAKANLRHTIRQLLE